jgi:hypothetical protein
MVSLYKLTYQTRDQGHEIKITRKKTKKTTKLVFLYKKILNDES